MSTLNLSAVALYLRGQGVDIDGDLSSRQLTSGRSNLTYVIADTTSQWVLRRPPVGGLTPSAHDVAREFTVTKALGSTGIPLAAAIALCEDLSVIGAPFTVVEFVDGRTIRSQDDLAELDADQVRACTAALVETFAALHDVDISRVGLTDFGRHDAYAARQLRRWGGQWDVVSTKSSPAADELVRRLRATAPDQTKASIVHGDYRIDNTLIDPNDAGKIAAVVDWELSTIGDPVADVAMMCAYRHPALDLVLAENAAWTSSRIPSPDELAALYESASGSSLENWDFFMSLSYYKLAVIAQGIDHRRRAGATTGGGFDTAGNAVERFLEAGLSISSNLARAGQR